MVTNKFQATVTDAVAFKGLQAVVDSTTEGLEAIVTVFKIWHILNSNLGIL